MKNILLFLLLIFFLGCDGKVFKNINDKSKIGIKIEKIEIDSTDLFSNKFIKSALQKKGFLVEKSEYKLSVEHRSYKNSCNNALVKATSNTAYDGLVAITLFYKESKIYTAYMDYRGKLSEAHFTKLIDEMMDDLEIKKE
ncbi:MAG: hypothetical protein PHO62_04545 [Sulfurimonas sp.]|uniref:hypothetical protein n=1 Tax=Sulfurimonas sp. TaxID=2022749 RepID=UPI00260ACC55|nr:hypothetical protein [Sulfurimonas sp.]MDD5372681.1 hypothetical protein [Sulfurimonas sp.]